METIISIVKKIRIRAMRTLRTREAYMSLSQTKPISRRYGYDRGTPVDRPFIEQFMTEFKHTVKGKCLEIVDNSYTVKYGEDRVTSSDVLDIIKRKGTTIYGDLRDVRGLIADNTFDSIIITQTYNVIDEYEAAIRESHRILKPGGTLLVTLPTMSPAWNLPINMWRFSTRGLEYVFGKYFSKEKLIVKGYGNKMLVEAFWIGMSHQDLTKEEIEKNDPRYPLIIGVAPTK